MQIKNLIVSLNGPISVYLPDSNSLYKLSSISSLNCLVYDDSINQIIKAIIRPAITPIYLYSEDTYQNLIELSDQNLSFRILEIFGVLIEDKLNDLISMNPGYRRV